MSSKTQELETKMITSLYHLLKVDDAVQEGTVVFLNGPWGCGKTYFWLNSLLPLLQKDHGYAYISLFGVQSVSDLKAKILSSLIADGKGDTGFIAKGRNLFSKLNIPENVGAIAERFAGSSFKIDLFEMIRSRRVICFDDLERLPSSADIEEILGFINYLSEHKHYKCLIVMNEAEMKPAHKESFSRLKEKLSLRTFQLSFNFTERFDTFLNSKCAKHKLSLDNSEKEFLKKTIEKANINNLRTVRFIIDCYLELRLGMDEKIPESAVILLVAMIDFESKGNAVDTKFYKFDGEAIQYKEYRRQKDDTQKDSKPDNQTVFYSSYYGDSVKYLFFQTIDDLVHQGYFDNISAKEELFPKTEDLSPPDKLALDLRNTHYFFTSDDDLKKIISSIEGYFKTEKNISFETLFALVKGYSSAYKLLEPQEPSNLPEGFENAAKTSISGTDNPLSYTDNFGMGTNNILKIFLDSIETICLDEDRQRLQKQMDDLVSVGKKIEITDHILSNSALLETIYTSGTIEKIWNSTFMPLTEKYRLMEQLLKSMVRNKHFKPGIVPELTSTHTFLTTQFNSATEKMDRLRIFRLLEETGMTLPTRPHSAGR
jgi:hypothetical protein